MRWTNDLVTLATRASKKACSNRQEKARQKYIAVLRRLTNRLDSRFVDSATLKAHSGVKPTSVAQTLRNMERYGLIQKVRRVPQHWTYKITLGDTEEELK